MNGYQDEPDRREDSKDRYKFIVDNAPVGVYTSTVDGKLLYVNKALAKMFGFDSPEEMMSQGVVSRYKDPKRREDLLKILEEKRNVVDFEVEVLTKNGEIKEVSLSAHLEKGIISGMIFDITERKRAEEQLVYLAGLQENMFDAVVSTDLDFRIRSWNKAAEHLYRLKEGEVLGKKLGEVTNSNYIGTCEEAVLKKLIDSGNWSGGAIQTRRDGKEIHVQMSHSLLKDTSGNTLGVVSVVRDITQEKKASEELLNKSEALARRVKQLDCLHRISKLTEIYDISLEEFLRGVAEIMPHSSLYPEIACSRIILDEKEFGIGRCEDVAHSVFTDIYMGEEKVGRIGLVYREEIPGKQAERLLEDEKTFLEAIAEHIGRFVEYKRAQEELERSRERFKILFDYAPIAYFLINSEGKFVDGNLQAERLLGLSKGDFRGVNLLDVEAIPEDEAERMKATLLKTLKGEPTGPDEYTFVREDGSKLSVETRAYPVMIDGERMVLATARDITEEKRVEQAKRNFLSNISHELRTPLTSIHGYTKFMLSGKIGKLSERHEKCLRIVDEESRRLKELIDNLLDMMTIDAEGLRMNLSRVSVSSIIDSLITSFNLQLEMKGISFHTNIQPDIGEIWGDRTRLHQLFSNLLGNAIKFTPNGGSISIRSREKDENIVIEVEDSGVGIPSSELPHVFERFYQVDNSPSRRFGGAGLGLSICSEIAEAHGGFIEVESQPGKGSIFRVELPKYSEVLHGKEKDNGSG